jgi:hypothetical protein
MGNNKSLFDEIGIAGAGVILILVGIVLATSHVGTWDAFCITLGISFVSFAGAKESNGTLQIIVGIICAGFFLAALGILLASLT